MISPTACGALLVLAPPRSPRKTSCNPHGLVEPWWNPGKTLGERWGNLTPGPPRTTPEPIWAETPKLSAVGEKQKATTSVANRFDLGSLGPQNHRPRPQIAAPPGAFSARSAAPAPAAMKSGAALGGGFALSQGALRWSWTNR